MKIYLVVSSLILFKTFNQNIKRKASLSKYRCLKHVIKSYVQPTDTSYSHKNRTNTDIDHMGTNTYVNADKSR